MRLLSCSGEPLVKQFHDPSARPPYAILSHTWLQDDEEVSFAEITTGTTDYSKLGWLKVAKAREQALAHRFGYIWIDTCCIDKSSSAELSETINSMYNWYGEAGICMVYLADLSLKQGDLIGQLKPCKWFSRGWTLQEMLAPNPGLVKLFDEAWNMIGSLRQLATEVESVTKIHAGLLRTNSFFRLQEAILWAHAEDQSILLWRRDDGDDQNQLLAPSPRQFAHCHGITLLREYPGTCEKGQQLEVVSNGIRLHAPIINSPKNFVAELERPYVALIKCQDHNDEKVSIFVLELLPRIGTAHYVALQPHAIDAYTTAKYALRAQPLPIYFFDTAQQPLIQLEGAPKTPLSIDRLLVRWAGKESRASRAIKHFSPVHPWDPVTESFELKLASDGQALGGHFCVVNTPLRDASVRICFALQIFTSPPACLRIAIKIVVGDMVENELLTEQLLSSTYCRKIIIQNLPPSAIDTSAGDKVGDFIIASTTTRFSWNKLMHARVMPAQLSGRTHLVIEVHCITSILMLHCRRFLGRAKILPGLLSDVYTKVTSITPAEQFDMAETIDKLLMHNSQYADRNELRLAVDTGWYDKHDSNPQLWSQLRRRRVGRLSRETWLGYTLSRKRSRFKSWKEVKKWLLHDLVGILWHYALLLSVLEYLFLAILIFKPPLHVLVNLFFAIFMLSNG